jgi:glycosyltransferase involved in cell wall biosynthesis
VRVPLKRSPAAALPPKAHYYFRTQSTGAEAVHIAGIAQALESLGFSVVFSSPSPSDPKQTAGSSPFHSSGLGKVDGATARSMLVVEGYVVIGFVGWFVHWHRLDRLLIAMAHLGQQRPNLRLVLVGEGPLEPELRMLASKLGIGERVVFAGPAPHNEIPSRIAAFDVAVVPHSNAYRSPIKLFEYMAQARAVVAPDTEPIASVVSHGENGLLFNPDEESALEQCLEQALTSADLRTALGESARRAVLERHTWEANAARLLRALNLSPSPGIPAGTGAPLRPKAGLPVDEQQS